MREHFWTMLLKCHKVHNVMLQDAVSFHWVKGKVFPIHAMKSYRECRGIYLHLFLTWAIDRKEWSTSWPSHFIPRNTMGSCYRVYTAVHKASESSKQHEQFSLWAELALWTTLHPLLSQNIVHRCIGQSLCSGILLWRCNMMLFHALLYFGAEMVEQAFITSHNARWNITDCLQDVTCWVQRVPR